MHWLKLYIIGCICILSNFCLGQDPVYKTLNANTGLPSNTVYDIFQDKQGYIWIAHEKGLSRYNGTNIKNYKQNNLQSKSVTNIMLSQDGVIYCQDFTGSFYFVKNDSLVKEPHIPSVGNYTRATINKYNELIFTGANVQDGVRVYNLTTKQLSFYPKPGYYLYDTYNGCAYFAKDSIYIFNEGKKFIPLEKTNWNSGYNAKLFDDKLFYFPKKTDAPIMTCTNHNFNAYNVLPKGNIILNTTYVDHTIWVFTRTGAYALDKNLKVKYNGFCFFKNYSVSNAIMDKEGNYWFSTLDNGVFFVPNLNSRLYKYDNLFITSLHANKDKDYLYAATSRGGLLQFDFKANQFTPTYQSNQPHDVNQVYVDDANGDIYLSAFSLINIKKDRDEVENIAAVKNIAKISDGIFAYAQSSTFGIFKTKDITLPQWLDTATVEANLYNCKRFPTDVLRCRWVDFDRTTQTFYAATSIGIFYYSPTQKGKVLFKNQEIFANNLVVKNEKLYINTFSSGLLIAEHNNIIKQLNQTNGLLSNNVLKVYVDGQSIWLLFETGVQMYNSMNGQLITYKKDYGLPNAEYKDIAVTDNTVYLATSNGLAQFNVLQQNPKIESTICLDYIAVNNTSIYQQKSLHLKPTENNLEVYFSVLNYANTEDIVILYKINNGNWLELEKGRRSISLNSLSAGSYTLQIMPQSSRFISNVNTLEINFTVEARVYQTWWFWSLIAALLFLLFWFYYQRVLRQQKEKSTLNEDKLLLEKELQKSMLSSIKSQMNPHFLFNALNTIQSYIYTNDKENASAYLGKFSELTRLILDMSNKETIALSAEIRALELYLELEKLRFEDGLEYNITVDKDLDTETTYIPSMLIQPYVENAIKHGLLHKKGIGKVVLNFEKQANGTLKISIDDNGIGIKKSMELNSAKAKKHESFALNANRKRLDLLNKDRKNPISLLITEKTNDYHESTGTLVEMYI
jgi:signal transduction histidine kinase